MFSVLFAEKVTVKAGQTSTVILIIFASSPRSDRKPIQASFVYSIPFTARRT